MTGLARHGCKSDINIMGATNHFLIGVPTCPAKISRTRQPGLQNHELPCFFK
ncbi:hypothetical protein LEMLEM_LOCUS6650 [Lemmus lemmus]